MKKLMGYKNSIYKSTVLNLLGRIESPTHDDVWHEMCRGNGCPEDSCVHVGGPTKGRDNCRHIINVQSLVRRVKDILMSNIDW